MARSRSRSPPRGVVALRARLPYPHRTEAAELDNFVREWRLGLYAAPVVNAGRVYFPLAKEVPDWPGDFGRGSKNRMRCGTAAGSRALASSILVPADSCTALGCILYSAKIALRVPLVHSLINHFR